MTNQPPSLDAELAHADWQGIEQLLDELAGLARQDATTSAVFYRTLLERLTTALDADSGVIWSSGPGASVRLAHHCARNGATAQLARELLGERVAIVELALREAKPRTAGPFTTTSQSTWLNVHPVAPDGTSPSKGLAIELLTKHGITPAASRAYARVLAAVSELAEDFERRCELRSLRASADRWHQYEQFSQQVHRSLDTEQAAFALANEARRVVGCDRVSVLEVRKRVVRAAAVSGVDTLDRRSPAIRSLEQLGRSAASYGEPIWYYDGAADLADELLAPLEVYLEQTQARVLAIVPLLESVELDEHKTPHATHRVIGLLVAEHFHGTTSPDTFRDRLMAVSGHAAVALHNAQTHSRMPLARVSRALGHVRWLASARQLPKSVAAILVAAAVLALLILVPADFEVEAKGELRPRGRREVFASDDGVVAEILVKAGEQVTAGEPLIQLRKPELDLELRRVLGEVETNQKQLASVRAERLQDAPSTVNGPRRRDPHELAAEEEELKAKLAGLESQQKILAAQLAALTIRSPLTGQTLTWNVEQLLAARPVERGQALLSVANVDGPWELEVHVPDDRVGYILAARDELGPQLEVKFMLAADPNRTVSGKLLDFALTTELDTEQKSTVAAKVAFDRADVAGLRPGATAVAKVYCGQRSLGFVWFHDLYEYLDSWWW